MPSDGEGAFPTTRWTLILAAKSSPEGRRKALEHLATTYWKPLYVFLRKKGLDAQAAQDGVHDVVVQLLERDAIDVMNPARGKLRSYLRTVAQNYLINRHERATATKRGAGAVVVPIDEVLAERLVDEAAVDAEQAYERVWAQAVLSSALGRLESEYRSGARTGPYEVLHLYFGGGEPPPYRDVAQRHGMSLPQLKAFLHRARARFRELVRDEVAETTHSTEVDAELADVVRALS